MNNPLPYNVTFYDFIKKTNGNIMQEYRYSDIVLATHRQLLNTLARICGDKKTNGFRDTVIILTNKENSVNVNKKYEYNLGIDMILKDVLAILYKNEIRSFSKYEFITSYTFIPFDYMNVKITDNKATTLNDELAVLISAIGLKEVLELTKVLTKSVTLVRKEY